MNRVLRAAMISSCLVAFATSAGVIAQTTAVPPPPGASAPDQKMERRAFSRPTERVEARLAYIRTALKINERQQSVWDAYASEVRKNAQEMEKRFESMRSAMRGAGPGGPGRGPADMAPDGHGGSRLNANERLERMQSFHADALVRLNRRLEVQKPLYAALSPEQQKIADEVLASRGGPGRGGAGRGGHMDGRPMMGRGGYGRG